MCSGGIFILGHTSLSHRRAAGGFSYLEYDKKTQTALELPACKLHGPRLKSHGFVFEKVLPLCPHSEIRDSSPRHGSNMPVTWFPTQGGSEAGHQEGWEDG